MPEYILFTDTDCDFTSRTAAEAGYSLISMPYLIEEDCIFPWEDFDEFDFHAFYDMLREGTVPKTCSVNPERYIEYFEPAFASGKDIVFVHFSGQMSGTLQNMAVALDELKEKYPDRKVYAIDTLASCCCARNIALAIADLAKAGAAPEELVAWSEREVNHFAGFGVLEDLEYLVRGGRLPGFTGAIAKVIGIKPIIFIDTDGVLKSCGRVRGWRKAIRYFLERMDSLSFDPEKYRVVITHADAPEAAEKLKNAVLEAYDGKPEILIDYLNPTVGCHTGPGGVFISFYAKGRK